MDERQGTLLQIPAQVTTARSQTLFSHPANPGPDASPWCRTFPATRDQAREARRFIAAILNGHPATDNTVTCVSELAGNAIAHSRSGVPGGTFTVRLRRSGPAIRVEVTDNGGPWGNRPSGPEHGRGLKIVQKLSARQGITITGPRADPSRRTVWFEMPVP